MSVLVNPFRFTTPPSTLLDDLISWWTLNETTGTRIDSHGVNDLTPLGALSYAAGKQGNALDSPGGAGGIYLYRDSPTGINGGVVDYTIAAWVKADSLAGSKTVCTMAVGNSGIQTQNDYIIITTGTSLIFYIATGGTWRTVTYGSALSTATWYLVIASHENSSKTLRISVNAGAENSFVYTGTPNAVGTRFRIGEYHSFINFVWDGLIDEACFWNRLLTADERTALYNGGTGLTYTDL